MELGIADITYFQWGVTRNSLGYWSVLHPKRLCSEVDRFIGNHANGSNRYSYRSCYPLLCPSVLGTTKDLHLPLGEPVNALLRFGFSALEGISWRIFAGIVL